ncbi:MAG: ferritin-like domain-containing protein, partial [Candidatus Binatia bacterium]
LSAGPRLLQCLRRNRRRKVLEVLCREYVEEMESSLRLEWHAEQMRYPHFCQRLLRIAKEEQRHAQWLARRVTALGGRVPVIPFTPEEGRNSWQCLSEDLEAEKRCCADLTEELALGKNIDPDTAATLGRILDDEKTHRKEIAEMLMRSDPQAASV